MLMSLNPNSCLIPDPTRVIPPLAVTDEQWNAFAEEISRRLRREEELSFLHSVMVTVFHFRPPFFAELRERANRCGVLFAIAGYHWRPDGEPAVIVFNRNG